MSIQIVTLDQLSYNILFVRYQQKQQQSSMNEAEALASVQSMNMIIIEKSATSDEYFPILGCPRKILSDRSNSS